MSSKEAPFKSAITSAAASLTSSISFLTEPPSSTEAVAFVSPCPWPFVAGVDGVAVPESSASRRSTSFLAFAMFCAHVSLDHVDRKGRINLRAQSEQLGLPSNAPTSPQPSHEQQRHQTQP